MASFLSTILSSILMFVCLSDCQLEVHYNGIGTFTKNDFYDPKWRPIVFLPESPEKIDPKFLLTNRNNLDLEENLNFNETNSYYRSTNFDPNLETKIIIPGYVDNPLFGVWMRKLRDRFLMIDNFNIILIDWSKGNVQLYGQAVANTRIVGAMTGILIQNLCKAFNYSERKFHLLGHSLGAHISGYAGKWVNGQLGHITGFDPAGPYYEGLKNPAARLWHTDAQFVESIHTDARHLIPDLGFGMYETCSHVDIYPNGGHDQPGCNKQRFTSILTKGLVEGIRKIVECNHERSIDYYLEAIKSDFDNVKSSSSLLSSPLPIAYQCEDYNRFLHGKCADCGPDGSKCVILGPKSIDYKKFITDPKISEGKRFFMVTASEPNYFKYQYRVTIRMAKKTSSLIPQNGKIYLKLVGVNKYSKYYSPFNRNDQIFRYGNSYTSVILSDLSPETEFEAINFKWAASQFSLRKRTMEINGIEIQPLSFGNKIFGTTEFENSGRPKAIQNDDEAILLKKPKDV